MSAAHIAICTGARAGQPVVRFDFESRLAIAAERAELVAALDEIAHQPTPIIPPDGLLVDIYQKYLYLVVTARAALAKVSP